MLKQSFKSFTHKEKFSLIFFFLVFLISISFVSKNFYFAHSKIIPANGGKFTEGSLKQPLLINPLFSFTNSIDMDLVNLIFSSLIKYKPNGEIQLDLADKMEPSENGKELTFYLKKNVRWHDGQSFSAEDLIFTIQLIQNSKIRTPLKTYFQEVSLEKIDDYTIKFILQQPYPSFLASLTFGILPKHIWQDVAPEKLPLSEYNFKPIGTGPFKFQSLEKDKNGDILNILLKRNEDYFNKKPFLDNFEFLFFKDKSNLKKAFKEKKLSAVLLEDQKFLDQLSEPGNFKDYKLPLFQSSALFINDQNQPLLKNKEVRYALEYAINKEKIVQNILNKTGEVLKLPRFFGVEDPAIEARKYNPDKALEILKSLGWTKNDQGLLVKKIKNKTTPFKLTLYTSDWHDYMDTAQMIQTDLKRVGIDLAVETMQGARLKQNVILPRKFGLVLFGEISEYSPNPFIFWHSSQIKDPGLNISEFNNKDADQLLEEIQNSKDPSEKKEKTKEFLKILYQEAPAVFLYRPVYIYRVKDQFKGIQLGESIFPSERFNQVENWYLKTKRVWKK